MKDATEFLRPRSIDEAVAMLAAHEDARPLAGGATLVAMLNAGLVEPSAIISLSGIEELRGIQTGEGGWLRVGAMTRHAETAASALFKQGQRVVPHAAGQIANMPVRNMGTMGGSISFADPAIDYPPALTAAGAEIEIAGPNGTRRLTCGEFFLDWYTTALEPDELVTAIHIPPGPSGALGHYEKLARVSGDYAIVSVALVLSLEGDSCSAAQIAIGACGPVPIRLAEAENSLVGTTLDAATLAKAGAMLAEASDPVDDVRGSAQYRRRVIPRLLAKAVATVQGKAKENAA